MEEAKAEKLKTEMLKYQSTRQVRFGIAFQPFSLSAFQFFLFR
jgi:hypothetical protein